MSSYPSFPPGSINLLPDREVEELLARIKALEKSGLGVGPSIQFGTAILKWSVKSTLSAETRIKTTFPKAAKVIVAMGAQKFTVFGSISAANEIGLQGYSPVEFEAGTEEGVFWMAIGE